MKKILVPFDFSKPSYKALDYAFYLAGTSGAALGVLHVLKTHHQLLKNEEHLQAIEDSLQAREKEYTEKLEVLVDEGKSRGIKAHCMIFRHASVPEGIIEHVNTGGYELVVMANHGNSNLSSRILGGVSGKILNLSPVPVITLPEGWEKKSVNKVLVPVDFSEGSRHAAKQAMEAAKEFHAGLAFLFVIEEDEYPDIFNEFFYFEKKENLLLKNEILHALSDFVGIPPDQADFEVKAGQPHDEVIGFVSGRSVDMIAVPTTGQYLYDKILIGNTTDRILRTSPCPVMTIPFSVRNTNKTKYHVKFIEFMARYKTGHGTTEME